MNDYSLEISYRRGKATAAYLDLVCRPSERSYRTTRVEPGFIIDFNRRGKPIGIEITALSKLTLRNLNRLLRDLGLPPLKRADLGPLLAA
ncbi:MAG: DUF2283 domain-containing protein [Planctomycetes bacterium]|nr:DUF2283 domain-containing protein [Planctomycetota bacterium]